MSRGWLSAFYKAGMMGRLREAEPSIAVVGSNQRLGYKDHGGSGRPVFMLHSFLMNHEMFAPQVAAFGERYRLIGIDGRGHGHTSGEASFTYWDAARDVIGLMDLLGIEQAAIIGTSQGGFTALRAALLEPSRVVALCLLGTSAAPEPPENVAGYRAIVADWAARGGQQHVDMVATLSMGGYDAAAIKARWLECDGPQLVANMETLVTRDGLLDRLGEITCPTMVLHGTADAAYPVAHAREIAEGVSGPSELVLIDEGSHYLSLTDADAVNPHIERFLDVSWR